jgi:DNA-directed RNA polymerase subunit D
MVKIQVLKQKDNEATFVVEGVGPSFLNALRRAAVFEVPTLAIEDVYFVENSSALYDEIVAHRLGLIPLKTDLKSYNLPSECTCKGKLCAKCSVKGTLKAKGPATVYAEDLKIKDPSVKPIFGKIPIVKLLEGQNVELEFTAVLGLGMEHTKWTTSHFFYRAWPEFDTKDADLDKAFAGIPERAAKRSGRTVVIEDIESWQPSYEGMLEKHGVKVKGNESKFIVTLESWGQLSPEKILAEAIRVLEEKLKTVKLK